MYTMVITTQNQHEDRRLLPAENTAAAKTPMKISIVTNDGTTTYSETLSPVSTETEDFPAALEEATNAIDASPQSVSSLSGVSDEQTNCRTLKDIFQEAADTYQIDVNLLIAIAKQESAFQADATSKSGAQGIMQLMPATAQGLGVTDAYDPYENIMGGAKLMRQLLDRYQGDISLALAAYNAGSGNVAKYGGIPPFPETQNYVAKVTGYYNQGVSVPDITYPDSGSSDSSSSKEVIAANLETLLQEFPNHASYHAFLEQMNTLMSQEQSSSLKMQDAQTAYDHMLHTANQAIQNILEQRS